MHQDALRCTNIQSGVLIIKGLATQCKAKIINEKDRNNNEIRECFLEGCLNNKRDKEYLEKLISHNIKLCEYLF